MRPKDDKNTGTSSQRERAKSKSWLPRPYLLQGMIGRTTDDKLLSLARVPGWVCTGRGTGMGKVSEDDELSLGHADFESCGTSKWSCLKGSWMCGL